MQNHKSIVPTIVTASIIGVAAIGFVRTMREQTKIRNQINLDSKREIEAILHARDIVLEKIRKGEYHNTSFAGIMDDFAFYRITDRFED